MSMKKGYIINSETCMIFPECDQYGNLHSIVVENNATYKINLSPTKIIDYSLRQYGSSLRGANEGARMILGEIPMTPVVINEKRDLYWFPSKSPSKEDCVWLSINHVKDYTAHSKKQTKVLLLNHQEFILDISYFSFDKKIQRAFMLKGKIERRKMYISDYELLKMDFMSHKKVEEVNYEMLETH